jgi:Lysyl oxidase
VEDGLFEFASCHNHYHFRHYALYELIDPRTGFVWRAAKRGFCMIDVEKYQAYTGDADNKPHFRSCGAIGVPGNQGISKGWSDVYNWRLGGQYFVLDGGDGQPPVPPGEYIIRITVNPGFVPTGNEPCRFADPGRPGVCHQLPESDYENNVSQVTITIPDHPGRQGVGPLKNEPAITSEPIDHQ